MKLKPKGRKIYRQKKRFEKFQAFWDNTTAVVSTLLMVAVVAFVGYSAGAPILRFLQEKEVLKPPQKTAEVTTEPTPEIPQEENSAPQPPPENPEVDDHSADVHAQVIEEEPVTEPQTEAPTAPPMEVPEIRGWRLSTSELSTETTLQNALQTIPEQVTHVILPLKISGGQIYYATNFGSPSAVKAAVPLSTLYRKVEEMGFKPVAELNLLEDTIYSVKNPDSTYLLDDGSFWKDGMGRTYLSPFSSATMSYLSGLSAEIEQSGFTEIVCDGLIFPQFEENDLSHLDSRCSASDRYTALVEVVEKMQDSAPNLTFYVKIDGEAILDNQTATLSAADHLELDAIFVTMNAETFPEMDALREVSEEHPCILEWHDMGLPEGQETYIFDPHPSDIEPENTNEND